MTFRHVLALLTFSMVAANAVAFQRGSSRELGRGDAYEPYGRNSDARVLEMQVEPTRTIDSKPVAKDAIPTLTVTGEAELRRPADQVQIRLGVISDADEAPAAMQENSKRMNDVMAALERAGLTKKECETGQFQVQPRYTHPPRQPQPDWKPTISGYQVINRINIKTQKLDKIGDLLEAATSAGANSIDSINFDLADKRTHRSEAIAEATSNAVADAKTLSGAAGQKLVRVLSMSLDNAVMQPPPMPQQYMRGGVAAAEGIESPPINPGDITVRANVTIVYEIAPAS